MHFAFTRHHISAAVPDVTVSLICLYYFTSEATDRGGGGLVTCTRVRIHTVAAPVKGKNNVDDKSSGV